MNFSIIGFFFLFIFISTSNVFCYYDDEDDFHHHDHTGHDHDHIDQMEHVFRVASFDEVTSILNHTNAIKQKNYEFADFLSNCSKLDLETRQAYFRKEYTKFMLPSFTQQLEGERKCSMVDFGKCSEEITFGSYLMSVGVDDDVTNTNNNNNHNDIQNLKKFRLIYNNEQITIESELNQHAEVSCVFTLITTIQEQQQSQTQTQTHTQAQKQSKSTFTKIITGIEETKWVRSRQTGENWKLKARTIKLD